MELVGRCALFAFILLSLSCAKPSGESQFSGSGQIQVVVVPMRSTLLKSSTAQSDILPAEQFCGISEGERIALSGSPLVVQSENGVHYKIRLAEETILSQPCRLREGYLFAEHIRQEYLQTNRPPTATATAAPTSDSHTPADSAAKLFIWPVRQGVVTSGFGPRYGVIHEGVDVALPTGSTVVAAANGNVVFAGWSTRGYGNLIQLAHEGGYETRYGHNSDLRGMTAGKVVLQGDEIAKSGTSGLSTGPHVHFEIRLRGSAKNPVPLLPPWGGNQ